MASNRHLGRIISLQSLYEYEFRTKAGDASADINLIVAKNIIPYEKALGDTEFVYRLTSGVLEKIPELDAALTPLAPEWPISSISSIDRNILRMGLYELKFWAEEVPPKVVINEAVELAKAFGADNSSKFVNGVLGTAYKQLYPASQEQHHDRAKQPKAAAESSAPETSEKVS